MESKEIVLIAFIILSIVLIVYAFRNVNQINSLRKSSTVLLKALALYVPIVVFFVTRKLKHKNSTER